MFVRPKMKAVVSCISYGLGNQLMQFAAGYELSKRLKCPLNLDISWFDREPGTTAARSLLVTEIVPKHSFSQLLGYSRWHHFQDRTRRALAFSIQRPYRHGVPIWNRAVEKRQPFAQISNPICIVGVPGPEIALRQYRNEIIDLISMGLGGAAAVDAPPEKYAFVHVRRGDFVSSPHVKAKMVNLTRDYYKQAMRQYEIRNGRTKWILLSDEPRIALEYMPEGFSISPSEGASEIDDMFLMSRSSGGVIANSTFSLWGGFLAERNGGDVFAPARWREDGRSGPVLPATWMSV